MKEFFVKIIKKYRKLFITLIVLDSLALLLHLIWGRGIGFFNLDFEQNLPTTYQSAKLIILGLAFLFLGISVARTNNKVAKIERNFFLPLSVFMILLGFDELLQIHENIYRIFEYIDWLHPSKIVEASMKMGYRSSLWILYYMPFILIFVFWCGYWLRYFQAKMKNNAGLFLISSLCLLAVLLAEMLSSTGTYSDSGYFWLITIEEMAEMLLASTLVLIGSKTFVKHFR